MLQWGLVIGISLLIILPALVGLYLVSRGFVTGYWKNLRDNVDAERARRRNHLKSLADYESEHWV